MVKTNNISQIQNNKKLSIQVSLNGLSFCCKNLITKEITDFKAISFSEYPRSFKTEESLWKAFSENQQLINSYDEVCVLHQNNLNTWVPKELFDESQIGTYLQYNTKVFPTDFFAFDVLENSQLVNVYVPYVNITNFLLDQFATFEYQHSSSILVEKLLALDIKNEMPIMYAHFHQSQFDVVVLQENKLVFFNSFQFQTANDVMYYLLFVAEQLNLDPNEFELNILGFMDTEHPIFKKIYTFVRNVQIMDSNILHDKFSRTDEENIQNFVLFNL
uniref:DUF3822 family protein n=1 Tax=Flavobacterium sp. TaxID=239 RepID=UPI00404B2B37